MVSPNRAECANFLALKEFQEGEVDADHLDRHFGGGIQCIRVVIGSKQRTWVSISEIAIFTINRKNLPTEKIEKIYPPKKSNPRPKKIETTAGIHFSGIAVADAFKMLAQQNKSYAQFKVESPKQDSNRSNIVNKLQIDIFDAMPSPKSSLKTGKNELFRVNQNYSNISKSIPKFIGNNSLPPPAMPPHLHFNQTFPNKSNSTQKLS